MMQDLVSQDHTFTPSGHLFAARSWSRGMCDCRCWEGTFTSLL